MRKGDKLPKLFQDPMIQNWMNTFDDFFKEPFTNLLPAQSFRVDLYETDVAFIIEAELPGITKEQIKVEPLGDGLRISIESKSYEEERNDKQRYYKQERSYTSTSRTIKLPYHFSMENVKGKYTNGILEITIPKDDRIHEEASYLTID
ncbi:Hsp20/alpha crystallin family protein [Pseudalkalibacillus hwajinpoensis]|uniref:Hsp20/alpha crystallin family protein n=1 Tax=Guptibacillus hwajinpoensis TaxID=208199 RepID=A0A4U1MLD4_9BACL|nr:Hsp20/alpha crystallin family protein [Pseudalkalibacillus hwajinpoensis]TKD71514.1 Hsp20/alpha crystallin family protein [Pseudalkalibacillus hwajinpoensis]